jgi:hypothetical protein
MTTASSARFLGIALVLLLAGCSHRLPQATVEVIDTSMSITPRAEHAALDAIAAQIAHMRRGDPLILIPITGDAQNDAGGRILRLTAPAVREPYDTDLRRFQSEAQEQFAAWAASVDLHQSRTDILGALDVARQELSTIPKGSARRLIIVSDFLEDDGIYRFVSAGTLATPSRARDLAAHLREGHRFTLESVTLCLGRLESSDFAPLSAQRKEAVQAFWSAYLAEGREPAEIRFDGNGMLADTEHDCDDSKR